MLMSEIGMGTIVVKQILSNIYGANEKTLMRNHLREIMKLDTSQFEKYMESVKTEIVNDKLVTETELNRINNYIAEVKSYF